MSSLDLAAALAVARRAAADAGALLRAGQRQGVTVEYKGEVDPVTDCDRRSERLVVGALADAFPDHAVVGEEGMELCGDGGELVWYVDPLDGTVNFAHGLHWYAVSIGLERAGLPVLGVVLAPELDWEWWGIEGSGAFFNGQRVTVSEAPLDRALLATGFPYDRRTSADNNVPQLTAALRHGQGIRRMGVASLDAALVASGRLDGYWEFKLKPWDVSAGALLVREAGGRVTDLDGGPFDSRSGRILATNGRFHDELARLLTNL